MKPWGQYSCPDSYEGHPAGSETLCRAQDGTGHRHLLAFTKMKYKYPSIRTVTTLAGQYYEARPQTWVAADRRQTKTLTFRGPLRIMCRPCIQCILISSPLSQLLSHPCLFLCASWDWGWALGRRSTLWAENVRWIQEAGRKGKAV